MTAWWDNGIVYHLYIKSFFGSQGIGDFKGITQKLDYLQTLGVDAVWLSPFFDSPMRDNGYDIKDYRNVNPLFGTNQDLDLLFSEMKRRSIKIIIDLVLNHSSNEHPWFQEALKNPQSKYRDYYIFKPKEKINNARSLFGNSTWEATPDGQYYYHTFAVEQPELNWESPALRQEIYDIINYWLDKGVDGFRLDAITFIKKNPEYPSLEADDIDGLFKCTETSLNQPGILDFLTELKAKTWGNKPIYTVGEAPGVSYDELSKYISSNGILTSVFDFSYTDIDTSGDGWRIAFDWTYDDFQKRLDNMQLKTQEIGTAVTYLENHDNPRSVNKFYQKMHIDPKHHTAMATALHMFFLFLRGTAFLYQGEEIGMQNIDFKSIEDFEDLHTIDQYERALRKGMSKKDALQLINKRSRDHSRVPVFWSEDQFKIEPKMKPFVRTKAEYACDPVDQQLKDPKSILNFVQKLIALKKSDRLESFLIHADYAVNKAYDSVITYKRVLDQQEMIVYINMTDHVKHVKVVSHDVLVSNYAKSSFNGVLEAYESIILTKNI